MEQTFAHLGLSSSSIFGTNERTTKHGGAYRPGLPGEEGAHPRTVGRQAQYYGVGPEQGRTRQD